MDRSTPPWWKRGFLAQRARRAQRAPPIGGGGAACPPQNRRGPRRNDCVVVHGFSETALGKRGPAGSNVAVKLILDGAICYGPVFGTLPGSDRGQLRLCGPNRVERAFCEGARSRRPASLVAHGRASLEHTLPQTACRSAKLRGLADDSRVTNRVPRRYSRPPATGSLNMAHSA